METTISTEVAQIKISKYAPQIKYITNKRKTDEEFKKKGYEISNTINKNRYANDPEYREKEKAASKLRYQKRKEASLNASA